MNRKQLTILIALVVVLGGIGLAVSKRQNDSWNAAGSNMGQKLLPDLPINDVAQISLKQTQGELNLVKDEIWRVKERFNYPANFSSIGDLLRKVSDLKVAQPIKVGPSQLGRLELLPPEKGTNSGTLVDFKDKTGKTIKSLLLGKKAMRESQNDSPFGGGDLPIGRYVMVPGEQLSVALVSEPLSDIETKPSQWLSKDFFKVEKLRSISVTSTNATNSWKLVRETEGGELKLADKREGEEFDAAKASSLGFALSSPSFNDVVAPDAASDLTGMDQPLVASLETFDNFVYTVKIGKKTDDDNFHFKVAVDAKITKERVPGKDEKPEDKEKLDKEHQETVKKLEEKLKAEKEVEKWTYLVSKWTIDPILKERKDLLAEKKEEKPEEKKDDQTSVPSLNLDQITNILPETKTEAK